MKKLLACTVIIVTLFFSDYSFADPQVFSKTAFEEIKKQHLGKRWLMILWSVDCPACFKELALIQKLRVDNSDINVVFINVDDNYEVEDERQKVISSYELSSLQNYYFADGEGDQARYIIDSTWYGELPRSYFIESNGKFHGKSGLVKEKSVRKWLIEN